MKKPHRLSICATSIAAFLAASPESPGVNYGVLLGDTQIEGGLVTGGTGLTKTGGGTLVLGNAGNNYTGLTTISNGAIVISNPAALGADASAVVITGFNPTPGVNATRGFGGGSLVLNGLGGGFTLARDLALQGQGPIADRGGAVISIGDNVLSGVVNLNQPAFGTNVNSTLIAVGGTLGFTGTVNVPGVAGTAIATLGGANQGGVAFYNLTGSLTGTGTLSKNGGGTLFLNPSSTAGFSGTIRTNGGNASGQNSIRISTPNVLGSRTATGTGSVLDLNGGFLEVLMDVPSVLAGGTPANIYTRTTGTIFADKSVGSLATSGTVAFGQLAHEETVGNLSTTFSSRNGFGMSFGASPVQGGSGNSFFTNNLAGGLLTLTGNFWNNADFGGSRTFNLGGNGDTRIDGNIVASAAANDHSFTKTGTGTLTVTGTGTTLDGNFTIGGGTVATRRIVGGLLGTAPSAGALNLGVTTIAGTLNYLGAASTGAGETVTRTVALAGTTGGGRINANQAGSAPTPLIIAGTLSVNTGSKSLTLGGASALENEIQSAIPNPPTGTLSVQKTNPGTWVLSGPNTYSGTTGISGGTLKVKANGVASTVLNDSSPIVFNIDAVTQAAGGRLLFTSGPAGATEQIGQLTQLFGHSTISVANGGGLTTLAVNGFISSTAGSVNFDAPTPLDAVNVGFVDAPLGGQTYFNGANFAYADGGGTLRAPIYNSDLGFVSSPLAPAAGFHNELTGSAASGGVTVDTLKISGAQTLTMSGTLGINGASTGFAGLLVDGGNAVIAQGGGGAISHAGAVTLAIRVNQAGDSLTLGVPITGSVAQGLSKNGLGTLILAAANAQGGTTSINEGTVRLAPGGRLSVANQGLAIRQGGTLDLNGMTQPNNTIGAFNGAGTVTNSSATTADFAFGNNNQSGTFSGVIQDGVGRINVLKQSTGNPVLTGLNTYTGATTIASTGTLTVTNLANIGAPSGLGRGDATSAASNADSLVFTGAQLVSGTTGLSLPGGLIYTGTSQVTTDRLFRLGGTGAGAGARIQASGANNVGLVFGNTAPIAYTLAASTVAQHLVLSGPNTADNRIDLQLVDSGVVGGSLRVNKIDSGKWVLGNPGNSYTGATKINGGALEAYDGLSLPSSSPLLFGGTLAIPTGGVLETSGTFTRVVSVGTVANTVNFNANGNFPGSGGFASSAGKLSVNLGGASAPLTWGAGGFLMPGTTAATLRLSSATALGEVEFQNPINLGSLSRTIQVDDNGNIGADFATLAGVLSGAGGSLNKNGAGTLALTGANTYTGTTTVNVGTLIVRSLGNSASPGATSVGDSTAGNTDSGAVLLGNGGTGAGILQYVGPGETSDRKIRFNTTTGTTQIHADGSGPLILQNVANDVATGAKNLTLRGTNAGGNRVDNTLTDSPFGGGFVFGPLSVTVDGSAAWILNAANTYTGNTTSNGGALGIGNNLALGPAGTLVLINGNVFAYGGDRTIPNPVVHGNNFTQGFVGDYSLTFDSPLTFNLSSLLVGTNNNIAPGKILSFAGVTANLLTANRIWTIDGAGETVIAGNITSTTAFGLGIVKTGTGTLVLNGAGSDFTQNGANLDLDNGTVKLGATNAIPSGIGYGGVIFTPEVAQNEAATLNLNGFSQTLNRLVGTGASTIDNVSGSAATLTVGLHDGDVNFSGVIANSGGGPLSLVKVGTSVGVLGGANTYSGTTEVRQGTLSNGASEVIPGALIVNAAEATPTATYDLAGHNETVSALTFGAATSSTVPYVNTVTTGVGTLTLDGDVTTEAGHPNSRAELQGNVQMAATRTFSVADALNEEVDFTVTGVLAGPGAVTKAGLGTMKIRGLATYSGVTTVNLGRLLVEGSISGAVAVAGGTLGGTGSVGAITATSGVVSPGESIGTLTGSSLTMSGSSSFALEIDTTTATHDILNTTGPLALSLAGTPLTITDLGANFALTEGARFRFLTYGGGQTGLFSVSGNAIDDDLEFFTVGANTFAIDYNDLGGTAVSLVVVPEPGIAASLLAGLGLLAGLRRRRR